VASSSQDRQPLQLRPPALVPRTPASTRSTLLKLFAFSVVVGLLLISLDFTPSFFLEVGADIGGMLSNLSHGLWRVFEIILGCALAGAVIVIPLWGLKRIRARMVARASVEASARPTAGPAKSLGEKSIQAFASTDRVAGAKSADQSRPAVTNV
jgi:hypothetical protein